jgi:hypothetical protein
MRRTVPLITALAALALPGAALAVPSQSVRQAPVDAQYVAPVVAPAVAPTPPAAGGALPAQETVSPAPESQPSEGGTAPARETVSDSAPAAQALEESAGDSLPFTGFAAALVGLFGAMFVAGGLVLRRRTGQLPV